MTPLALVEDLAPDFAHPGICLCLWRQPRHHSLYVQVLDDQCLELVHKSRGHLVLGVAPESGYSSLKSVYAPLRLPPATAVRCSAGLRSLQSSQFALGLVMCLGILLDLSLGVGRHWTDARVHRACEQAGVRIGLCRRFSPVFHTQNPATVPTADMRFVWDTSRQRVGEFH